MRLYLDGALAGVAPVPNTGYGASSDRFVIAGGGIFDASGNHVEATIDEVRAAGVARSDEWVAAQQRSMSGSLVLAGAAESNCGPADAICDGWDADCDGSSDEDFVVEPTSCGVGACQASGIKTCEGGAVVDSCAPGSPAPDDATCNEVDDDCNGGVDDGVAPPAGTPLVSLTPVTLSWTAVDGATGYEVVSGDLAILRATGGEFARAVTACVDPFAPGPALAWRADPLPGEGAWVLVRAVNCAGAASFDGEIPPQIASRDEGIAASPAGCAAR
jgi:hypothetical protein